MTAESNTTDSAAAAGSPRKSWLLALCRLPHSQPWRRFSCCPAHGRPRHKRNPGVRSASRRPRPGWPRSTAAVCQASISSLFKGKVTVLNVWSSWCAPCREEHPILLGLARDGRFDLIGLDYKDPPDKALKFLADFGTPFSVIGIDPDGRAAIDWGVYGVPETFVVGKDGKIAFKHVGPLTGGLGEVRTTAADRKGARGKVADAPVVSPRCAFAQGFPLSFLGVSRNHR